jgi:peptidoglycan/xylan/chitin deacetylase (PgdA/CDA1 family)
MFRSPKILRWLYPKRIWGISVSRPTVFLTFDDGPDLEITPWLLDFLNQEGIVATFFCVGSNVKKHTEIYAQILADGHSVGNHLMNHENGFKTKDEVYLDSIDEAAKLIDSPLFRPAYGRLKRSVERKIRSKYKVVMWSWLSYDYDVTIPIEKIIQQAKSIQSGDILVFHDNKKTKERLKEVLPTIVWDLKKRGFGFGVIQKS